MKSFVSFFILVFLANSTILAQSMTVDMNPSITGIQDTMKSTVANETFIVELIGSDFTNVSGYQFKIVFDSTRFDFLQGAQDYGMTGMQNILKSNSGAVTGIFQKQANPKCDSILDVAYTINGTTNLSVSGTGLLGIVQFKSKLKACESGAIKITSGDLVDFNGVKTPVTTYTSGIRYFPSSSGLVQSQQLHAINACHISYSNNIVHFELPSENDFNKNVKIVLYDLKGGLELVLLNGLLSSGRHDISLENTHFKISQGFHICALNYGSEIKTLKIFIGK